MDCIFCQIVAKQKNEAIVYEDAQVMAFMDRFRQPSCEGHVLVIPKTHYETFWDLSDDLCNPLMHVGQCMTRAVKNAFLCSGVRLWMANGHSAGQEVAHLHLHIFPCHSVWDRVKYLFPSLTGKRKFNDCELEEMAAKIRHVLSV